LRIDLHVWFHDDPATHLILNRLGKIMSTQAELAASLAAVSTQVAKIGTETSGLQAKIAELEAAILAAGGTTPEVDAALAALKAQVQVVDDLVIDAA
jgi:septal ring factor EnvC (AmiA/AmiB activator)